MTQNIIPSDRLKVWDPLVRVFHWSLVLAFVIAYVTEDDWLNLHVATGDLVALLISFRLVWGVIGTKYARFTQFVKSPAIVLDHLKSMLKLKVRHYLGHNPAAAAMVVALLISLALLTFSGYVLIAADNQGVLAGTFFAQFNSHLMEDVHEFFAHFTLLLIFAHVGGVIVSSLMEKENLPRAMVRGYKKYRSDYVDVQKEQI